MEKLKRPFYTRDTLTVARDLLGKIFVYKRDDTTLKGRIVETEAYLGVADKAAHTYGGRRTARNEIMYAEGGHLYVYFIYGMHHMINVVTNKAELGEAVLIRGMEPLPASLEAFAQNRYGKDYDALSQYQKKNLSNGPGKLTRALSITREDNGTDLTGDTIYLLDDGWRDFTIITDKRIGIEYAEEAIDYPYRFYFAGNPHVSK